MFGQRPLAFRLGVIRDRGGYITDATSGNDINSRAVCRHAKRRDITLDASVRFILDAAESDSVCCGAVPSAQARRRPINALTQAQAFSRVP